MFRNERDTPDDCLPIWMLYIYIYLRIIIVTLRRNLVRSSGVCLINTAHLRDGLWRARVLFIPSLDKRIVYVRHACKCVI
jgi:hypothetical protein